MTTVLTMMRGAVISLRSHGDSTNVPLRTMRTELMRPMSFDFMLCSSVPKPGSFVALHPTVGCQQAGNEDEGRVLLARKRSSDKMATELTSSSATKCQFVQSNSFQHTVEERSKAKEHDWRSAKSLDTLMTVRV